MADEVPAGGSGVDSAKVEQAKQTAESLLEKGAVEDALPDEFKFLKESHCFSS